MSNQELLEKLSALIDPVASKLKTEREYWIGEWDESISFCWKCAKKKVEELLKEEPKEEYFVAGGWGIEGEYIPSCDTCHVHLENSLKDFGCEQELDYFKVNGFDPKSPLDCYTLKEILCSHPFEGGELSGRIQELARKIIQPNAE